MPPASTSRDRRQPLDDLFSVTYEELRRLASTVKRDDASATISPTALVNEAWMKLAASPQVAATSPLHFKRLAARAMRQILVEAARRRHASKRGHGAAMVSLDEASDRVHATPPDVLALDQALSELTNMSPRQAQMIELRFFGGFDVLETAELLGVSEATVMRDWRVARAWLAQQIRRR
ncbi:MAG TPA: ECF-type sigma factor [Luteitalea sp.]|nr:ECF-type sigma factor [Luteitalea sp.]